MKRTSVHVVNMWIKQLCNRKVRNIAMALRAPNVSGAFEKQNWRVTRAPGVTKFLEIQTGSEKYSLRKHKITSKLVYMVTRDYRRKRLNPPYRSSNLRWNKTVSCKHLDFDAALMVPKYFPTIVKHIVIISGNTVGYHWLPYNLATSFQGSLFLPPHRASEERPWHTLVTCHVDIWKHR